MPATTHTLLPALLVTLGLVACAPPEAGKSDAKPEAKADTKPDAKPADAKPAEAKPVPAKADTPPASTGDTAGQANASTPPAPPPPTASFRKGQTAPRGLPLDQLLAYNKAQGDPIDGEFTLEQAFAGDAKLADKAGGKLFATFDTTMGKFTCELFEGQTPKTVANFVGLARGTRPFFDKAADAWKSEPFFDGILFHRVIRGFMIQTGDRQGTGTGFPGFLVADEIDPALKHNKAGILSMANRGPNTGSSQFFVTVAATPHLDGTHAVFGQCEPKVPVKISEVKVKSVPPTIDSRPLDDIKINKITFERRKK